MVGPELFLTNLHHLHKQLFGLLPSALFPICRRQVGYIRQHVGMVGPELVLVRLYYLYLQLFGLFPSALFLIRRYQVGYIRQCIGIVGPEFVLARFYLLQEKGGSTSLSCTQSNLPVIKLEKD